MGGVTRATVRPLNSGGAVSASNSIATLNSADRLWSRGGFKSWIIAANG